MATREEHLGAIKTLLLRGFAGRPFWPALVMPSDIKSSDMVKKLLKNAGYAEPSGLQDGFWILTEAGRTWLAD